MPNAIARVHKVKISMVTPSSHSDTDGVLEYVVTGKRSGFIAFPQFRRYASMPGYPPGNQMGSSGILSYAKYPLSAKYLYS